MRITQGQDTTLYFTVKNDAGGTVNLTGASLVFSLKVLRDDSSYAIQKKNLSAGGSDTQIGIVSASNGICKVNIARADTLNLTDQVFFYDLWAVVSSSNYIESGAIRMIPNVNNIGTDLTIRVYGTTLQRPVFTSGTNIGFQYFDTDEDVPRFWNGTDWV